VPSAWSTWKAGKYKIHTVGIEWENLHGIRVTPNVYTLTENLDLLVEGIQRFAAS
jgi:hypothetical protein